MDNFYKGQRWTSEGEPELGVGVVFEVNKNRVHVHFSSASETRIYAAASAPLKRVVFKPGDTIIDNNKRKMIVDQVREHQGLITYIGAERVLPECDLGDITVKHTVDEQLLKGRVDTPHLFALRRNALQYDYQRRISPINGFTGGRIDLIPHQLYIAHEVSSRYKPRVLLSDQVGLGKTIEACLILHRLISSGRAARILILVPEALVHQWFVELLRRFNLWFHLFDEERCASLDEGAPEGNPFLDDQLIICSTNFLAHSPKRAQQALSAEWDMLVVDEAHHLEWSPEKVSNEYAIVELLSQVADGLLLLTATPEQLGAESHFARLRLLDPDRFTDYETFKNESNDHKKVAKLVHNLSANNPLDPEEQSLLTRLTGDKNLKRLDKLTPVAKNQLIEGLLDQHGPGRVIFRNTRAAMTGFPSRRAHLTPVSTTEDSEIWKKRLTKEYNIDHEIVDEKPRFWFATDPRIKWLISLIHNIAPAKILLICKTKEKVLALERVLKEQSTAHVSLFHEELTIVQRDRNAAWFSEPNGANILLCSEIGSEGRNFQFAHHLVLFDLPINPELLEQRIGRLDRIGQTNDIQIHVPYIKGSPQEVLVRWYHEGLNAFEENIEGGNEIGRHFQDRLAMLATEAATKEVNEPLNVLIQDTSHYQQALKEKLNDGRDRLLEMNSYRPSVAKRLVKLMSEADKNNLLEHYMTEVFEHFGIDMEDLAPRTYLLHPVKANREAFPSIPDGGISVTFDRKKALSREDMSFLSWDHPMATGALDVVLSSKTGTTSFAVLKDSNTTGLLLEVIFVLETVKKNGVYIDRFLPATPIRIVVNHSVELVTDLYPIDLLEKQLRPSRIDRLLANDTLVETIIPNMVAAALAHADHERINVIESGMRKMNLTLDHEIGRLAKLAKSNNAIRPDEIEAAFGEKKELSALIEHARLRMDAIQLISVEE